MEKIKAYGICVYQKNDKNTKILLCKSSKSTTRWGFLKGVQNKNETNIQTALREFFEESSIRIDEKNLEKYFFQENMTKNIGIYLVNYVKIIQIDEYFDLDKLKDEYISSENSEVRFFALDNLPQIKKKQQQICDDIVAYLQGK
jgi:ADP-ribose pyrophosphatase YjhB (NUDIX family)